MAMMSTGFRIPPSRSPSLPSGFSPQLSRIAPVRRSASLSVRGRSNESGGNARDPSQDTRIHWGSSNEGWIGIPEPPAAADAPSPGEEVLSPWLRDRNGPLMGILVHAADSHYRYLELTPDAETEEIKAAYRRLSKTYHPDTTSLPLEVAAEKFVRLKRAYTVLSSEEQRRLYDWQLAQKLYPQQRGGKIYTYDYGKTMADDGSRIAPPRRDNDFIDSRVDTLGGRNMALSSQAQSAIIFDAFAVIVAIFSIIYVIFFKQT